MADFDRIFSRTGTKRPETPRHPRRDTKWIHYTKMTDNQAQYCNEKDKTEIVALAGLIDAEGGILQNLLVRKSDADEYEIIAGHKRRRACKYLVEEEGKQQYEFLPCLVEELSDVRAEFQVYSSNSHHEKDDYEKMHELKRMKHLLETYPEEFPGLKGGRMVERLAKQMHMTKTAVGEYFTISKNLGEKGMEEFAKGSLKKSAAVELSGLPRKEQDMLIDQGVTSYSGIKSYKEKKAPKKNGKNSPDENKQLNGSRRPDEEKRPDENKQPDGNRQPDGKKQQDREPSCYTLDYFLKEQEQKLHKMQKEPEGRLARIDLERQKIIVEALSLLAFETREKARIKQ